MSEEADLRIRPPTERNDASYGSIDVRLGNSAARQFFFRTEASDGNVIQQILVNKEYDLGRLRRLTELKSFLKRQSTMGKAPLVVDAGANIGASSLFFATIIPDSSVVAIEPHADNFRLLEMNVEGLQVQTIRAAVSSTQGRAQVTDPGEGHWGYRTEKLEGDITAKDSVPRVTINEIYREHSAHCFPFIVKIDIEGGEADLFSSNTEWVAITPLLIIELHDWLLTKSGNSRAFLQCISQLNRDFVYIGESIYSIANDL